MEFNYPLLRFCETPIPLNEQAFCICLQSCVSYSLFEIRFACSSRNSHTKTQHACPTTVLAPPINAGKVNKGNTPSPSLHPNSLIQQRLRRPACKSSTSKACRTCDSPCGALWPATIAANDFRFRVPYGTLLCVSDSV